MADWHVLGAGALGCLWAAGLAGAGHQVELLLKNRERLALFQRRGAVSLLHRHKQENFAVTASMTQGGTTPINHLLVTTKAHQTLAALHDAAPRLARDCPVLLVQNGMGVAEQITDTFPGIKLFCGVTTDGAYCPEPFSVVHAAAGETVIGAYGDAVAVEPLLAHLPGHFLRLKSCSDINDRQWHKLAINCAVNGLTALYQCRNGDLLTIAAARQRLERLCEEIARVGEALGFVQWQRTLLRDTLSVIRLTAQNYSSMYQDINNGRTTEIDYLNGYLINKARQSGIACPENEMLYETIKQREGTYRRRK